MSRGPKKKIDGISYEEFRRQVKSGHVENLYLFVGEEEYLQERAIQVLRNSLDEAMRLFNYASFTIGEAAAGVRMTTAMAIDNANQFPMMSPRRITVIRAFDKVKED